MGNVLPPDLNAPMDPLEQAYYEGKFEIAYLKTKADSFQSFFEELMGKAYKADFIACRPWGNQGDWKNDGFLHSERRLFQVYAPNEMEAKAAIEKINVDFDGAKPKWGTHFQRWTFAHNAYGGLSAPIIKALLDLEADNPSITIDSWGLEEFRTVFRKIERADLQAWFGFAPSIATRAKLGNDDLQVVLKAIAVKGPVGDVPPHDVPLGKIKKNSLSPAIQEQINQGAGKRFLVGEFFEDWYDPTFGEQIAAAFRSKYKELRDGRSPRLTPDEIYQELVTWAGGSERGKPEHEMAIITVLAYYFDSCDIFEPHRSAVYDLAH